MTCPIRVKRYCVKPYERKGSPVKGYCVSEHDRKCKGTQSVVVHQYKRTESSYGGPNKRLDRLNSIQGSAVGVVETKGGRTGRATTHFIYRGDKGVGAYLQGGTPGMKTKEGHSFTTQKKSGNNVVIKRRKYPVRK